MASHLILGGSGFLGRALLRELGPRGIGTYTRHPFPHGQPFDARTQRLADIPQLPADLSHVFVLFGDINPDRIAREPEATRAINVDATIRLLDEIFGRGLVPVYLSTDYVFDGIAGGFTEDDPVAPTTAYGRQKVEVETWLRARREPWLICRSSKIVSGEIGTHSVLGQWVEQIRAGSVMRCSVDQFFSPALDADMAKALVALADGGHRGIFHVAGPEPTSRYGLAKRLADAVNAVSPGTTVNLQSARLSDFPFAEPRPLKTWLNVDKLLSTVNVRFTPMADLCHAIARDGFGGLADAPAPSHREAGTAAPDTESAFDAVVAENHALRVELGRLQAQIVGEQASAGMPIPWVIERYHAYTSVPLRLRAHQVAFLHIGKAAGTSIHHLLIAAMPDAPRHHWAPELFDSATPDMFEGVGLVLGHFSWNHVAKLRRPTWLLTFLRDPVERLLSSYYYLRESDPVEDEDSATMWAKRLSIEEFFENDRPSITMFTVDHQCRALTGDWRAAPDSGHDHARLVEDALANLSTFGFVGFVEEFAASVKALCAILDLDPSEHTRHLNATRQRPLRSAVSDRAIDLILDRNKGDMALYAAARERFGGRMA